MQEFRDALEDMANFRGTCRKGVLIAGDFNAKAAGWGSPVTDARGRLVEEWAASCGLVALNNGGAPTFRRGEAASFIDITFATDNIAGEVRGWHVCEQESLSDHMCIRFEMRARDRIVSAPTGWRVGSADIEKLRDTLHKRLAECDGMSPRELTRVLENACREALTPRGQGRRKPVYWWTAAISQLRRTCLRFRRLLTRARRRRGPLADITVALTENLKVARRALRAEIAASKRQKWKELCDQLSEDPWGDAYKIVTKRLGRKAPSLDITTERACAALLFPAHPPVEYEEIVAADMPLFTREELEKACSKLRSNKSPGPDGIPPEVVKEAVAVKPCKVLLAMNEALKNEDFPEEWKTARLVLIQKGGKPEGQPSSYRPLCLLSTPGKLLEQLLVARLQEEVENAGGISERQYGFRKERSTVDAVNAVMDIFRRVTGGPQRTRRIAAVILLDIRNAFNSVSWSGILRRLRELGVSPYLRRMIQVYLKERSIIIGTGEQEKVKTTSGVPQGSILGPTLWNIVYDRVLHLEMPEGVTLIAYADDLAVTVTARREEELMEKGNSAMERVRQWLTTQDLALAPEKTEAVVMTRRRTLSDITFEVSGVVVRPKAKVKYLGVWLDSKGSFIPHVKETAEKTARMTAAISRLMCNTGGPSESKRRVIAAAGQSAMLYGAPVWSGALDYSKPRQALLRVQRQAALRITSAYRTVPLEASLVLAGTPPVHLLARERTENYTSARQGEEDKGAARLRLYRRWQDEWSTVSRGLWTRRLVPEVRDWVERKHGEVNFYLTQFLTGHGSFNYYLERMKRRETSRCAYCPEEDTAEHTIFHCERWDRERAACWRSVGHVTPETVVHRMLEQEENWEAVGKMVSKIMKTKMQEEPAHRN